MATVTASPLIRLHPADNILIARQPIAIGTELPEFGLRVKAQVPAGHKIAATPIAEGEPVRKYDTVIGVAAKDIAPGEHVHTHKLRFEEFARDPEFCLDVRPVEKLAPGTEATFMGIVRPDGRVATRNYIGIISSVNCSATSSGRRSSKTSCASRRARRRRASCSGWATTSSCLGRWAS
jgi:altronate hydrolase